MSTKPRKRRKIKANVLKLLYIDGQYFAQILQKDQTKLLRPIDSVAVIVDEVPVYEFMGEGKREEYIGFTLHGMVHVERVTNQKRQTIT